MLVNDLRRAFTDFFVARGHTPVSSMALIPHHPAAPLFTNAGMNQFLPYFLGEEPAPYPRATSIQKCVRIMGKHDDIENIGRTWGHFTFFEMLGNFSFGDYFKQGAIEMAWELSTEVLKLDGDRIWATVHHTDDEGADIWRDVIGLPAERIQRLGDDDNLWEMGETGPCGPCSELFYDRRPDAGDGGGPARDTDRYREFWNLVFMQNFRNADGSLSELPRKNIDTGFGLERGASVLQNVDSAYDTDEARRLVEVAERLTGRRYHDDPEVDVRLRILADHARSVSFLINDGIYPSNEERGYVLRRLMRRAVRHAYQLGVEKLVLPDLVGGVADVMGDAYPEMVNNRDVIAGIAEREEARFRQTLAAGSGMLDSELASGAKKISGALAFKLHDTFGFPIEVTREIGEERGVDVDMAGFDAAMAEQRQRARSARKTGGEGPGGVEAYAAVLAEHGPTEFTGYDDFESHAVVLAVLDREPAASDGDTGLVEIFLSRTPFYAEGGGQIGDTGTIVTSTGRAEVLDTNAPVGGLHRHVARIIEGEIHPGQDATATIDAPRRESIRRNHTGTHLLHWALREVLGKHVKQQGSLVAPEHLRFDFSHHGPLTAEEIDEVEALVNDRILDDEPVRISEMAKADAEAAGAIAFFGDKYGERVRVVEAGGKSVELCGGTHVSALGMIGTVRIVSEESIGANMRRIFATTGHGTIARMKQEETYLRSAAQLLKARPDEVPEAIDRLLARQKALADELKGLRTASATAEAATLAAEATDGVVVVRRDGLAQDQLRELALAVRDRPGVRAVVVGGSPDGQKAALVAAVAKDAGLVASDLLADAARTVGGGTGRNPDLAVAGGKDASRLDEALDLARAAAGPS